MKGMLMVGIISMGLLILPACGYTVPKYRSLAENVRALKATYSNPSQKFQSLSLSPSQKKTDSILCRLDDFIRPPEGKSFEEYVLGGLEDELKFGGLLEKDGTLSLEAEFNQIEFSSVGGNWIIDAKFSTPLGTSLQVKTEYHFEVSAIARDACTMVAEAFPVTVRQFIQEVTNHKTFKTLLE